MKMKAYSVKWVSQALGISPHTLRAWERRYSAIVPSRSDIGRRVYSQEEVDRLKLLTALTREGHAIGNIAVLPTENLKTLIQNSAGQYGSYSPPPSSRTPLQEELLHYRVRSMLEALREFRVSDVSHELEWARVSLSCSDFVLQVVSPLFGEVGRLVASGEFSISQEHALSAVVRDHIGEIFRLLQNHRAPLKRAQKENILLTTPEGDFHEFGILLSAVLCVNHGLPTHYLGANLPAEEICKTTHKLNTTLLILGNSPMPEEKVHMSIDEFFERLEVGLPAETEIWIGGQGTLPSFRQARKREIRVIPSLSELNQRLSDRILREPT